MTLEAPTAQAAYRLACAHVNPAASPAQEPARTGRTRLNILTRPRGKRPRGVSFLNLSALTNFRPAVAANEVGRVLRLGNVLLVICPSSQTSLCSRRGRNGRR